MKRIITNYFLLIGILISPIMFSQTDKTIAAFTRSIEQEKKAEYSAAIETIIGLADSTSYEVTIRLGWLYYKAGYKKASLSYYQKAIDTKPNAIEPKYGYGFPAYLLEDYKAVIEQDKKILEIDPNNKTILGNLGSLYYYSKDYKSALNYYDKIIKLYPFDYDANLMTAWAYLKMGKDLDAESYFNVVLLYSPKDASANEGLSYIKRQAPLNEKLVGAFTKSYELSEKNDYKSSIASLKEVYDATSYYINLRLGWLSYLAGLQMESSNYYKIATTLKPNAVEAKFGYALPSEMMGNKNDLKTQYDLILSIDPQNTSAHYKMGVLDYGKKDYLIALSHFEKVITLYPCDTDGLLMMGWTNYYLGKTTEARVYFNKVLCLSPNNASATQGLGLRALDQIKKTTGL